MRINTYSTILILTSKSILVSELHFWHQCQKYYSVFHSYKIVESLQHGVLHVKATHLLDSLLAGVLLVFTLLLELLKINHSCISTSVFFSVLLCSTASRFKNQCCGSGSALIRIKLKGRIRIRIRINVKSWIRIFIKVISRIRIRILINFQMKSPKCTVWALWAFIWKLGSGSGNASMIEVIGMIRIRIKVTRRIRIRIRNTSCKPGDPLQKQIRNSYPKMLIRGLFKENSHNKIGLQKWANDTLKETWRNLTVSLDFC